MTTTDDDAAPPNGSPSRNPLGSLLFRSPAPDPIPTPSPSLDPSPSSPPAESSPSASGWSDDGPSPAPGDLTSSPASWADDVEDAADDDDDAGRPGGLTAPLVSKASMRATFRQGVVIAGGMGHKFGARTAGQQAAGLFLADDDDAAGIGNPLADIAHRREGLGGKLSPDANDAVRAALALGGYVAKQLAALRVAAEHDASLTAGTDPQATPGAEVGL